MCAEPGCREAQFYEYETRADEREAYQHQQRNPYKCTRHNRPDDVLRPDHTAITRILTASKIRYGKDNNWLPGLYWISEGGSSGSGFAFGPGFKAHASDFPEGTRLVITAYVETPDQAEIAAAIDVGNSP